MSSNEVASAVYAPDEAALLESSGSYHSHPEVDDETSTTSSPKERFVNKFHAELQLLEAIQRPREYHARPGKSLKIPAPKKPWLTEAEAEREALDNPKYLEMSKKELEKFRPEVPIDVRNALNDMDLEAAKVKVLPRQVPIAESSTGLAKLQSTSKSRQLRHDEAVRRYKETVIQISESLETEVIAKGRGLRDKLENLDSEISKYVKELQKEDQLRMEEFSYLTTTWETLDNLCKERKKAITDFDQDMENIEHSRSKRVGNELQGLVDELVQISYKLRGEVERLMEREAHEVNIVLISNLKVKSELVARMLKKHVFVFHSTRASWEKAETRWRHLRHERALEEWQSLLNSQLFTNPEARNRIISTMVEEQLGRHEEQRLELFLELQRLVPVIDESSADIPSRLSDLSVARIQEIARQFESLDEQEKACCETASAQLHAQQESMVDHMCQTREALRAELHTYAALAEKGDIFTSGLRGEGSLHRIRLGEMVSNSSLDDFFRRSGGLKQELVAIITTLGAPELIHNTKLSKLLERVVLLSEASELATIKEREGKTSELKSLELTLEKLRTAKKAEIAPVVPVLFKQTIALKSSSIGESVAREIDLCLDLLESVQPGLQQKHRDEQRQEEASEEADNLEATAVSADPAKDDDTTVEDFDDEDDGEGKSKVQVDSAELAYKEKPLNLIDLRNAQRRIGTIVHMSNLSDEFIKEVCACRVTLENQIVVNEVVDGVITNHCSELIAQREVENKTEISRVELHAMTQRDRLRTNCSKICKYVEAISRLLDNCQVEEEKTDLYYENCLDNLLDSFEEADQQREAEFSSVVEQVRHAPNKEMLGRYFQNALRVLEDIDTGYREYHRDGIKLSKAHPKKASDQAEEHISLIGNHFGFSAFKEALTDQEGTTEDSIAETSVEAEGRVEGAETASQHDDDVEDDTAALDNTTDNEQEQEQEQEQDEEEEGKPAAETDLQDELEQDQEVVKNPTPTPPQPEDELRDQGPGILSVLGGRYKFVVDISNTDIAKQLLEFKTAEQLRAEEEKAAEDLAEREYDGEDNADEGTLEPDTTTTGETTEQDEDTTCPQQEINSQAGLQQNETESNLLVEEDDEEEEDPTDVLANPFRVEVTEIYVPCDFIADLVLGLRTAVLISSCESRRIRENELAAICEERCEEFTEELEERLRLHWPRCGRTDVKFQQPRSGELLQHQQRHDRHCRNIHLKMKAQSAQFERQLTKVEDSLKKFKQCMNGLVLHLEAQSNVASLQGIYKKGKNTIASFQETMKTRKDELLPFVRSDNELMQMNGTFLQTCTTFEEGGDYNTEEVKLEEESLQKVEEVITKELANRATRLQELFIKLKDSRVHFAAKFTADFEQCLQNLSVREGLGRKYGAPRRNAQEKLRSEIAVSDNAENFITTELRKLEQLCSDGNETEDKSLKLKVCLDGIRRCVYLRAKYLEFFEDIESVPTPELFELQDEPADPNAEGESDGRHFGAGNEELTLAMGTDFTLGATFWQVVRAADESCRQETRELYAKEGMLDELKLQSQTQGNTEDQGIPESLVLFLRDFDAKAQAHRENASRRLRDQVLRFQEILLAVPKAVLLDILVRNQVKTIRATTILQDKFDEFHNKAERARKGHLVMLHPTLGEPSQAADLSRLLDAERDRSRRSRLEIANAHKDILSLLRRDAGRFYQSMVHSCENMLRILDASVLPVDFKVLPGDELVVTKRMSLKRLRNLRKKKEKEGDNAALMGTDRKGRSSVGRKHWNPLNKSQLVEVNKKFSKEIGAEIDNEDPEKEGEEDEEKTTEQEAVEDERDALETYSTPQHKGVIHARERMYQAYVAWYEKTCKECDEKFKTLLTEEERWQTCWDQSVEQLKQLN